MSGYEKVSSSVPEEERDADAKVSVLSVRLGEQDRDVQDEKKEHLVAADGAGDDAEVLDDEPRPRRTRWWLVAALSLAPITVLAVAIFLIKALAFNRHSATPSTPSSSSTPSSDATTHDDVVSFRRPDSDYIIDPNWDFGAPPMVREYNWAIQDIVGNPDGVFRPMITINGKFPGEMIECNEGDTIVVNVENHSINATSIHWHGIFQNGTNWNDGTPGVTQCPIAPGRRLRYEFTVRGQSGTYFYHGHQAAQHLDGLVGPIVIHSPKEKEYQQIPYATDRVIMLQDWYYDLSSGLLRDTLSPGSESSPIPNAALINGASRVDCSLHPSRKCDNSSALLPTLNLAPNENHRLRLLNVGGFAWFEVTVDKHLALFMTEMDGNDIEPSPEPKLLVGPGQRYSTVLSANQTETDSFWFRAKMVTHCFSENVLPDKGVPESKAIVRYTSDSALLHENAAQVVLPTTQKNAGISTTECKDMRTRQYWPIPKISAPEYADHSWYLRASLEIGDWRLERGFLNTSTFRPNLESPTLHRVIQGFATGNETFHDHGVNSRAFDPDHELVISSHGVETVDIILQNFDQGNHPFHLHGTQLFVLAAGHGYFPGYEALGLQEGGKGLLSPANRTIVDNPMRRDVATVEGFGWLLVRFVADNPGLWLFHCHMIWHGEAGMAMQFLSRMDLMQNWTIPAQNLELCEADVEHLEKGGVPKDSIFYGTPG